MTPERRSFPREVGSLPAVFDFIDEFFDRAAIGGEHRVPVHFAVEELFTNLIKYGGGREEILVELRREPGRLAVSLTDLGGQPFDIRSAPDARVDLGPRERTPGGLGIHILKRMVDGIDYEYVDGRSTTTIFKKLG